MRLIVTDAKKQQYFAESTIESRPEAGEERPLVCLFPKKQYQKILGFGGALTQAAAWAWKSLDEDGRKEAVKAYYSEEGLGYTLGRMHINSCDFSLGNYTYVTEGDETLDSFSVECEEEYQLPLLREAEKEAGALTLLASPWSPPAYMKTNGEMNHGGKLKEEYRGLWAEYLAMYLKAYEEKGFCFDYLSIQNEPKAVQTWDSCIYTPQEEREFADGYLRPALKKSGLSTKILAWDHNKERVYDHADAYFSGDSSIDGEAFHWYSGDHFEQLRMVREDYPDKLLIFTEGCVEYSRFDKENQEQQAEMYAHDMIGNLEHGCNAFFDWNLFLDEKGGPNHVGNFCAAPIMIDTKEKKVERQLSYYYIGHLSRYIKPGAHRIGLSKYTASLDVTAFQNPDGSIVTVLLNKSDAEETVMLKNGGKICDLVLAPHTIATVIEEVSEGK